MLHYRPNTLETARLGVVVAKKLAKRATARNLVKRIVRDVFRRERAALPACDLIIRLHAGIDNATRADIHRDARQLLERLPRQ